MGIAGGILILVSIVFFALHTKSFIALLGFIIAAIVLVVVIIKLALWRIKKEKHGIYHSRDQEGYAASSYLKEMFGKEPLNRDWHTVGFVWAPDRITL